MHTQKQQIFKNRHIHMFLEKTAAFAFADVHMERHVVQGDVLAVIALDKGDDIPEPLQVFLRMPLLFRKVRKIMIEFPENLHEHDMNCKFIVRCFF